jgi:hypothetical protein
MLQNERLKPIQDLILGPTTSHILHPNGFGPSRASRLMKARARFRMALFGGANIVFR